ncbi:MAG: hypothetical protein HYT62_02160 [Candidatus Yanofskybacteria bacterium]|nr:hypothetical protein [Candidatus Yanofskybacteria bacterium]
MQFLKRLLNLIRSNQKTLVTSTTPTERVLNDFFPNMEELQQKLAEVGMGPMLPTLAGVPGKRSAEQFLQTGNPEHQHRFSEIRWDNEKLGPSVTDTDDGYYATFKSLFGCDCGALKVTSQRSFI